MDIRKQDADTFRRWIEAQAKNADAQSELRRATSVANEAKNNLDRATKAAENCARVGQNIRDSYLQIDNNLIHAHYDHSIVDGKVCNERITLAIAEVAVVERSRE